MYVYMDGVTNTLLLPSPTLAETVDITGW